MDIKAWLRVLQSLQLFGGCLGGEGDEEGGKVLWSAGLVYGGEGEGGRGVRTGPEGVIRGWKVDGGRKQEVT